VYGAPIAGSVVWLVVAGEESDTVARLRWLAHGRSPGSTLRGDFLSTPPMLLATGAECNKTRTDRNSNIGRKYLRRKKGKNSDRKSEKIKGKKVAFDSTAADIAKEE
jgi:hypothetical protein